MKPLSGRRIGFIGTGVMGRWMIGHLAAAGAELAIHNHSRAKAEALAGPGIRVTDTPSEAAQGADAVVLMVTDTGAVESALFAQGGAESSLDGGALVIDMGT